MKYNSSCIIVFNLNFFSVKFLPKMDKIIVMKDGEISEQGTYHELLKAGGQFADFLVEYLAEEAESEVEEFEELKHTLVRLPT